jgi:hypothetical protein
LRVIRKVPELVDHFLDKAKGLLHDRNHGVLLAGVTLVTEMCRLDRGVCDAFRKVNCYIDMRMTNRLTEIVLFNRRYPYW